MVVVEHGEQLFPRAGFIRGDLRQILHKFALFLLEDSQNERLFIGVIAVEGHFGDASMFSNPLGDTAVLRQRCIMPDLAARRAKSKSAAVYAASVPPIKTRLRRHTQVMSLCF